MLRQSWYLGLRRAPCTIPRPNRLGEGDPLPQKRCAADTFIRLDLLAHAQFCLHCRPQPERPCTTTVATERSGGCRRPTALAEVDRGSSDCLKVVANPRIGI